MAAFKTIHEGKQADRNNYANFHWRPFEISFIIPTTYSNLIQSAIIMGPKKHLGQHFLTSPAYARKIAEAVPAQTGDHVLEIGPGRGALTIFLKELFPGPGLHCVEVDRDAIVRLREKLGEGSYTIHEADVLAFDFGKAGFPLHVVGNLPYSIGALIIKKTLCYGNAIRSFTFMVQREVAERIVAKPHRKVMGFLSVFCQYFGTPKLLFHVPPGAFFPKPKVDSSVVQMVMNGDAGQRLPPGAWSGFFAFVSKAYTMRRKKLAKAVAADSGERERCEQILGRMGCDPFSRAEDLGINEWVELYKQWRA
jgi:16S rRNA (adenine1518-N6/adenine1519-N6)-dimethyltransferase